VWAEHKLRSRRRGLILDVAGGIAIASGFIFKRAHERQEEAGSYFNWNPPLEASLAMQSADAWTGAVLLTLGFAGQLAAAVGARPQWLSLGLALGLGVAFDVGTAAVLLRVLRPWQVRRALKYRLETNPRDSWASMLRIYGGRLNRPMRPRPGEVPNAYGQRLFGLRSWSRLVGSESLPDAMSLPFQLAVGESSSRAVRDVEPATRRAARPRMRRRDLDATHHPRRGTRPVDRLAKRRARPQPLNY
jgi:hypothetical protein